MSLGCPKALVDSERILTHLRAEGYELARRHDGADAFVIVNTCGFLDSAKAESLSAIGGGHGGERPRHRDRLHGRPAEEEYSRKVPEPPRGHGAAGLRIGGGGRVHEAVPRPTTRSLDLVPPQGVKLTPRHYGI